MKNFSNTYIFIFSAVMVVLVALLLSTAAMNLKPYQDKNIEVEKKQNILASVKISSTPENAVELYAKYIQQFCGKQQREKVDGLDAFTLDTKMNKASLLQKENYQCLLRIRKRFECLCYPAKGERALGTNLGVYVIFTRHEYRVWCSI
jgi:Na+-transporting NADH:ubiquinone oxidoreductase subunit NqrC